MNLRLYLLGLLTEEQKNEIEKGYFTDDDHFGQILAAEDELIQSFIDGKLSRRERNRFQEYLLPDPIWQQRVANMRVLTQIVNEKNIQAHSEKISLVQKITDWGKDFIAGLFEQKMVVGLSYAAILVIFFISSVWVHFQFRSFNTQVADLKSEQASWYQESNELRQQIEKQTSIASEFSEKFAQEQQQRLQLEQQLDRAKSEAMPTLAFVLDPGILRDAESKHQLVIPGTVQRIKLDLFIESEVDFKNYRVVLTTVEGNQVWSQITPVRQKQNWGQTINLSLPVIALPANDFILTLSGINAPGDFEVIHRYFFSVVRN